jgi:phosphatidate phosphatase PAH1
MNVLNWAVNSVLGEQRRGTGAIDVVAIRGSDGTITSCSPFHVKLPVPSAAQLRQKDLVGDVGSTARNRLLVRLRINGEVPNLSMKLGSAGEAFFVEKTNALHCAAI